MSKKKTPKTTCRAARVKLSAIAVSNCDLKKILCRSHAAESKAFLICKVDRGGPNCKAGSVLKSGLLRCKSRLGFQDKGDGVTRCEAGHRRKVGREPFRQIMRVFSADDLREPPTAGSSRASPGRLLRPRCGRHRIAGPGIGTGASPSRVCSVLGRQGGYRCSAVGCPGVTGSRSNHDGRQNHPEGKVVHYSSLTPEIVVPFIP